MLTDKFFAHFASKRKEIRFVPNVRHIKLNKVILNQINMAADVFFSSFKDLHSLTLIDSFKEKP
jgi:hypothetical protein